MNRIDILLATYNGAAFLEAQLESIAAQTHEDWRLIARDDGSTDRTPEILSAFQVRHAGRVEILADGDGNLGLVQNFSRLLENSDAPYAAFCDQDDVWIPEKLELCLAKMCELERAHGAETPLLVFTDLEVVDEDLNVIDRSFWHYANLRPDRCNSLNRLLLQNVVTGCTALMNRCLVETAIPIPAESVVHDWWVTLIAAGCGRVSFLACPTVHYRQHGRNIIGARSLALKALPKLVKQFLADYHSNRSQMRSRFEQGQIFLERYGTALSEEKQQMLKVFLTIPEGNLVGRLIRISRRRMSPTGFWRFCLYALLFSGKDGQRAINSKRWRSGYSS